MRIYILQYMKKINNQIWTWRFLLVVSCILSLFLLMNRCGFAEGKNNAPSPLIMVKDQIGRNEYHSFDSLIVMILLFWPMNTNTYYLTVQEVQCEKSRLMSWEGPFSFLR